MKIAYVTIQDALNVRSWSGTLYYMAQSLKSNSIELEYIHALKDNYFLSLLNHARGFLHYRLFNKTYLKEYDRLILKSYSHQASKKLSSLSNIDIVFHPLTALIPFMKCDQPVVLWSDAAFAAMIDFYECYSNLCNETVRNGHKDYQSSRQV